MAQYFSTDISLILTLIAAVMWGSWMMVMKFRKDYPVEGIVFLLYTFSFLLIGAVTLILAPKLLPQGLDGIVSQSGDIVIYIVFSGALMSCGMYFNLQVISAAGLLMATAISTSLANVLGIVTTLLTESAPDKVGAIPLYLFVTLLFIAGALVCNMASDSRDRDLGKPAGKRTMSIKMLLYAVLSAILINGWAQGTAAGTANDIPPIATCFFMALGSFLSVLIICSITFTRKHQWRQVLCIDKAPKKPMLLGAIAAVCHYGGNLLSLYSMTALSASVSFLLGRVYGVITILWGLVFREFAGSSKRTKTLLTIGVALNIVAILILAWFMYT